MTEDEEMEDVKQADRGPGDVVRVTIVMPPTMYRAVREGADDEKKLVGEYVRDMLRDALDRDENWVVCPDKDCSQPVDSRYNYCPWCGEEIPEQEDEDEDDSDEK